MRDYWLLFAFLTPILLAVNSIVNKWLIDKHFKDPFSSLIFMLLGNIVLIPVVFFFKMRTTPAELLYSLVLGVIYGLMFYFNLKAVQFTDASKVAIFSRTKPIFVMLMAWVMFGERLTLGAYAGLLCLSLAGMLVVYGDVRKNTKLGIGTYLNLIVFVLLSSLVSIGRKQMIVSQDFWSSFYWINMGSILGGLILLIHPKIRSNFGKQLMVIPPKVYWVKMLSQLIYTLGFFFNSYALIVGPVSIVAGVYSIQPFFVLLYSTIISKFSPHVISEDITRKGLANKVLAVIILIVGSLLIIAN